MRRWKSGRLIGGGGGGGKGRGGAGNVLPSEFLLGGNIHDPLNLNSLSDEKLRMGKLLGYHYYTDEIRLQKFKGVPI